jgi:hypothetical protein
MQRDFEARRARAQKAKGEEASKLWFDLANDSRLPSPQYEELPLRLRDQLTKLNEKSPRLKLWRDALAHLEPIQLSYLSSQWPDPEISAAMVRALRARKRDDEASGECRAALGRWSAGDVPILVEACKDCRAGQYAFGAGPAMHSVFRHWMPGGSSWDYQLGLRKGLEGSPWMTKPMVMTGSRSDPLIAGMIAAREPIGIVIGDGAEYAGMLHLPFIATTPGPIPGEPLRTDMPPSSVRALVPRPGPGKLAGLLLDASHPRKLALLMPDTGGDLRLRRALLAAAATRGIAADTITYVAGRRDRRGEAAALKGYDAVALLGPGDESADWLPALRGIQVLGNEQIDPAGFHEQARTAAEGAIFVRSYYAPVDTAGVREAESAEWVAGWLVGDAIAHGADSPKTLQGALNARSSDGDQREAWVDVPPAIARIEVFRVRGGRAEPLR